MIGRFIQSKSICSKSHQYSNASCLQYDGPWKMILVYTKNIDSIIVPNYEIDMVYSKFENTSKICFKQISVVLNCKTFITFDSIFELAG